MVTYLGTNSRLILIKLLLSYFATKPFLVLQDKEILLDKPVRCKHLTNRFHFEFKSLVNRAGSVEITKSYCFKLIEFSKFIHRFGLAHDQVLVTDSM